MVRDGRRGKGDKEKERGLGRWLGREVAGGGRGAAHTPPITS